MAIPAEDSVETAIAHIFILWVYLNHMQHFQKKSHHSF